MMRLLTITLLTLALSGCMAGCAEWRDIDTLHKDLIRKSESG